MSSVIEQAAGEDFSEQTKIPLEIFDAEDLLGRLMGDRQLAGIVLKTFLEDMPALLKSLREGLGKGSAPGTAAQAHALKGAAATVSAKALCAVAKTMELAAKAGQLDECGELLPRAVEEFERFKSILERDGWV
jgi:two-component system, sensor histidine kinase and response regulator